MRYLKRFAVQTKFLREHRATGPYLLLAILLVAGAAWGVSRQAGPKRPLQVLGTHGKLVVLPAAHGAGRDCAECHSQASDDETAMLRSIPASQSPIGEGEEEGEHEEEGGPARRLDWFAWQRAYPLDTLPKDARPRAYAEMRQKASLQSTAAEQWVNIGPAPMRNSIIGQQAVDVTGRVTALAVDRRNSNVVYLGAAQGGVWKTTNGGTSWTPLTDDQPSLAVGALTLDPQNPNVIYVGTGEPHASGDTYYGAGVLKSTDGGSTWQQLGASEFTGLGISAIIVHPSNSNTIYVASSAAVGQQGSQTPSQGIFKSTDGGQTWSGQRVCSSCWGASDLVIDPSNPSVLYAAFWQQGIFKSTNGGDSWQKLTSGLPTANYGRIELAIAPSNGSVLYAGYDITIPGQYIGAKVYRTTNGGGSWQHLTQAPNYCGGQCWYDNIIAVHPTDPNKVYLGGSANYVSRPTWSIRQVVVMSNDGGTTWWDMSPNDSAAHTLHPDVHAIIFDPSNPQTVWTGNDGGVWKSTDGGLNWINKNSDLATLQFIGVAAHPTNPQIAFGGMQDNNKAQYTGSVSWEAMDGGDGGHAAIDPFDPRYLYGTRYGISFQRNDKGGTSPFADWPLKTNGINLNDRSLFYAPFTLDPSSSGVLYYGTHRVYRTSNRGDWWQAISGDLTQGGSRDGVSTIAVAPTAPAVIYAGTSDGQVQVTLNTGGYWSNVTRHPLPNRFVSEIAVSPSSHLVAYAVFNGFNTHTPSSPGHVFKTTDGGATWRDISSNLPDIPALCIALDRDAPGTIYLGTDIGVFRSTNDGVSWTAFSNGMANVAVFDLALNPTTDRLLAATHGRSIYRLEITAEPTPTATVTRTVDPTPTATWAASPTPTRTPAAAVFLPIIARNPVVVPTATVDATATTGPTPTRELTPTLAPTPTREPTVPPPIPPSPVTFFDDFGNAASGWVDGSATGCVTGYLGHEYEISTTDSCAVWAPTSHGATGLLKVTAHATDADSGAFYGLVFAGQSAPLELIAFWIDPAFQEFAVIRYSDQDGWTGLVDSTFSPAINGGTAANDLAVRRDGAWIYFYVNDVYLGYVPDISRSENTLVGLIAASASGSWADTRFDDFYTTEPTVAFEDSFASTASGWYIGAGDYCQAAYEDEEYRVTTVPDEACLYPAPSYPFPDGTFEVQARAADDLYPTAYGLAFAVDATVSHFYSLWVYPDGMQYALLSYDSGEWEALIPWSWHASINPGVGLNKITVLRDSGYIALWINDVFLTEIVDDAFPDDGYFGLLNLASRYAPATAYFDDCRVFIWDVAPWMAGAPAPGERPSVVHLSTPGELPDEQ